MSGGVDGASALYRGAVMHRRLRPRRHRLDYRVFSALLDLDDLPDMSRRLRWFAHNRFAPVSFHDRDHGPGDGAPLRPWVEAELARAGLDLGGGPIRVLCYPRLWGYVFNPLTVYFCHHPDGRLGAVLHEVNNTFGDRHCYLIPVADADGHAPVVRQTCDKRMYVSPFMEMETTYHFRIRPPAETVSVVIRQTDAEGTILVASFTGDRAPLTDRALAAAVARHPLMTVKVMAGIHWEALKLFAKGMRLRPRGTAPADLVTVVRPADGVGTPRVTAPS
ncbi:DUF1365 domain-containing protein [Roseospira visakhapatnamensis]|uniref:DUF1365 domain-containing protein n=1 Tax=Roseospira visakhapatnamensis TaxID=390880 RepID=A0A7W6W9H8_9PROT|nr:DUF1365 domain-containing protein [Roseospira visakhapatnamensis]MBB4265833.1 hypothetical protein [Roseospira visakhapatnamensis]